MQIEDAHRPWPVPRRPWSVAMTWHDLSFMHWPVSVACLRELVPHQLEIDTFEGQAWIGLVPFHMTGIRHRFVPPLPGLSAFPELNVRTYVVAEDKPGVWFFSLDAAHSTAVIMARLTYGLPYYRARMRVENDEGSIHYRSHRIHGGAPEADLQARYRPTGDVFRSQRGSLEHWLTERYCLYSVKNQKLYRGEIHHEPWPLQPAEVDIECNTMTRPLNIPIPDTAPLLHFARRLEVVAWRLEQLA